MTEESVSNPIEPKQKFGPCDTITLVSGLALIALMFIPWFTWVGSGISIIMGGETRNPGGNLSAWQFFGGMAWLFLIVGILAVVVALLRRSVPSGAGTVLSILVAVLGLVVAAITMWNVGSPPLVNVDRGAITIMDMDSAPAVGAYLGMMATLGIAIGGLMTLKRIRDWA
jgi:hypothetical protein